MLGNLLGCTVVAAAMLTSPIASAADRSMVAPVAALYKSFAWQALSSDENVFGKCVDDQSRETLAHYFDAQLTALILEDKACKQREGVCRIESDILFDSQDPRVSDLKIAPSGKNTVAVQYKDPVTGEVIAMQFVMHRQANLWRINDIIYLREGTYSLRKLLSVHEARRGK